MSFSLSADRPANIVVEGAYSRKASRHLQETRNINTAVFYPGTVYSGESRFPAPARQQEFSED